MKRVYDFVDLEDMREAVAALERERAWNADTEIDVDHLK